VALRIEFTAGAARQIQRLPENIRARLGPHISGLADNSHPRGSKKLAGTEGYRLRVGDYRVLYEIDNDASRVLIVRVAHRREVYRGL
jgi:mRNA interferase RelE/StbE